MPVALLELTMMFYLFQVENVYGDQDQFTVSVFDDYNNTTSLATGVLT